MTTKFDKELDQLSKDDYQALLEQGKDIATKLVSGEIHVQRELTFLRSIKPQLLDCIESGLTYSDIARAYNRVDSKFKFKPAQIKKVCEEGKKSRKKRSTKKRSNTENVTFNTPNNSQQNSPADNSHQANNSQQNSTVNNSSSVIPHTQSNHSEAEDL